MTRSISWGAVLTCCAVMVCEGIGLVVYGNVIPSLLEDGSMSVDKAAAGNVGSLVFAGMFAGGIAAGRIGLALGPKRVVVSGVVCFSAATLLSGLSPNLIALASARFVTGVGLGVVLPIAISIARRGVEDREAPLVVSVVMSGVPIGGTIAALAVSGSVGLEWRAPLGHCLRCRIRCFRVGLGPPSRRWTRGREGRFLAGLLARHVRGIPPPPDRGMLAGDVLRPLRLLRRHDVAHPAHAGVRHSPRRLAPAFAGAERGGDCGIPWDVSRLAEDRCEEGRGGERHPRGREPLRHIGQAREFCRARGVGGRDGRLRHKRAEPSERARVQRLPGRDEKLCARLHPRLRQAWGGVCAYLRWCNTSGGIWSVFRAHLLWSRIFNRVHFVTCVHR